MKNAKGGLPISDNEPRMHSSDAPPSVAEARPHDSGPRLPQNDSSRGDEDASSTIAPAELRAYLSLPATQKRISEIVGSFVGRNTPQFVKEEIGQEANIAALDAKSLPRSTETMPGWLGTVTRRAVYHYFRRAKADLTWLNRDVDPDETAGAAPEVPADGWLVSGWLAPAVAHHERDQETYEMIRYKARTGRTDEEVAADHGITYAAWTHRLGRFKSKYLPRWRRRQLAVVLLLVGGAALIIVIAWLLWKAGQPSIRPDTAEPIVRPRPSASAPVVPSVRHFDQALPTGPDKP
jgi:DNA-directed RNA polymerase specialized sigma24 family protein